MRGEPTTSELQALAARQQHQLDTQARLIAAREHRLRQVQEGVQNDQVIGGGEAERLRKLRERVEAQEAKLRKLRALRGQTDQQRITNGSLSADLTSIRALFNEKEKELSMAAAQVEELTRQLDQFQQQQQAGMSNGSYHQQAHPGSKAYFVQLHLERLRAELMYRNKLNEQKSSELREKKSRLSGNREKVAECELRIVELRDRLQRKKQLNQQLAVQLSEKSAAASSSGRNNRLGVQLGGQPQQHQQVAAVEPFNRSSSTSRDTFDDVTDFTASKSDHKYQTLPYNTRFLPSSFLNNNNNRLSPITTSSGGKGGVKIASVPPQTVQADRPALPPKPLPAAQYKPLLPPRQTVVPQQVETASSAGEVPTSGSPQPSAADGLEKNDFTKPKPISSLKKHTIPPPPPPLPPSHPPILPLEYQEDGKQMDDDVKAVDDDRMDTMESRSESELPLSVPQESNDEDMRLHPENGSRTVPIGSSLDDEFADDPNQAPPSPPPSLPEEYILDDEDLDHSSLQGLTHGVADPLNDPPTPPPPQQEGAARRLLKKGNLKAAGPVDALRKARRVSFDPLALLLDASLEGELELVKKTALEVTNPSAANDEGITALHNAICAGHLDIVRFLVELGCDVNAQDSDGWTPLHCAASCNNLAMVRFLVEHGACIFAATLSDQETAAEKCEEDEEGFDGCSEYLYSIQEKLGILNGGRVSAVYDYEAQNPDELSFSEGDELVVLRKGDDFEREWWWSRLNDHEGYVPRNLLGLYPRMKRKELEE